MVATRQWAARLFWGALLGFLVAMAGWSAVILTMNRNLDTVSFIALLIPVFGFAVLGWHDPEAELRAHGRRRHRRDRTRPRRRPR